MVQAKLRKMKLMMNASFVPQTKGMKKRVDKARTELMMVHKRCEMRPDNVSLARDAVVLQQEFRKI